MNDQPPGVLKLSTVMMLKFELLRRQKVVVMMLLNVTKIEG